MERKKDWDSKEGQRPSTTMILIRRFEREICGKYTSLKSVDSFISTRRGSSSCLVFIQALTEEDNILCTYREHVIAPRKRPWIPTQSWRRCMGSRRRCSKGRWRIYAKSFWMHQKFFGRKCNRPAGIALAVRRLWQPKKQRKIMWLALFFLERGSLRQKRSFKESMNLCFFMASFQPLFVLANNLYCMGVLLSN